MRRDPLSEAAVTLQTAVSLHQDGKVKQAEAAYRRVLALDPANADALNLLGMVHHGYGEHEAAVRLA
jgi:Flp pilus assembly protein TadD